MALGLRYISACGRNTQPDGVELSVEVPIARNLESTSISLVVKVLCFLEWKAKKLRGAELKVGRLGSLWVGRASIHFCLWQKHSA